MKKEELLNFKKYGEYGGIIFFLIAYFVLIISYYIAPLLIDVGITLIEAIIGETQNTLLVISYSGLYLFWILIINIIPETLMVMPILKKEKQKPKQQEMIVAILTIVFGLIGTAIIWFMIEGAISIVPDGHAKSILSTGILEMWLIIVLINPIYKIIKGIQT